ncbi:MAG: patatin-like phospholipase family protein [Peptostreptococcaceae bacterium]|nr:patatin-like phospholipase family protein [Peptostreptococcaceae bacterium]
MGKLGLVLEGGGAKGAYQVGAYKALMELGIEIDGIAGTSIGAINGAMIAQGSFERCYDVWHGIRPSTLFDVDEGYIKRIIGFELDEKSLSYAAKAIKEIMQNNGLDTTLVKGIIRDNIDEKMLRDSKMDFGFVTFSLTDMKPLELYKEDVPLGKMHDYIMASASVPVFKLEKIDNKIFIDGGFHDNMPVNLLARKGYKDIIVIRSFGMGRVKKVDHENLNITYITPSEPLGRTLDFTNDKALRNIEMGYYDTLRLYRGYRGEKYCIETDAGEDFFLDFFKGLDEKTVLEMGRVFGISGMPWRRMLFEHILPRMAAVLDLKDTATYGDLLLRFLEQQAKAYNVNRFAVYSMEELFNEAKKKYKPTNSGVFNKLPDFVKQNELLMLSRNVKDEILAEFMGILMNREEKKTDLFISDKANRKVARDIEKGRKRNGKQ